METFIFPPWDLPLCAVSTLPIRNGNNKLSLTIKPVIHTFCKYLTYKEWKQFLIVIIQSSLKYCKYLTYKEWKRFEKPTSNIPIILCVSTLPIRNGNRLHIICTVFSSILLVIVSTLPIRNGNSERALATATP